MPGGSEPRAIDNRTMDNKQVVKYLAMPKKTSLLDLMRKDIEDADDKWESPPTSPDRARTPTLGFSYDYATDAPPDIQRIEERPMNSSPYPEPPNLSARPGPVLLPPRSRSTSVPPIPMTVKKVAKRYMPVTETVTPPISPARASAMEPETSLPTQCHGRSRGRGKWRAPPTTTSGVGTRSQTRQAELEAAEATRAQATRAVWPEQPDRTMEIQRITRDLHLRDRQTSRHFQRNSKNSPSIQYIDENQNKVRHPAAGIHSHQQDVFFIPPRALVVALWGHQPP